MWCQHCISKKRGKKAGRTAWKQTHLWGCRQQCIVHLFIPTTHVNCASKLCQLHLHPRSHHLLSCSCHGFLMETLLLQYSPHRISRLQFLNANFLLLLWRLIFFSMEENTKPETQPLDVRESALWVLLLKQPDVTSAQQAPSTWVLLFPTSDSREHWALLLYFIEKMFPYSWVSS